MFATEHLAVDGAQGLLRRAVFLAPAPIVLGVAWRFRQFAGAWLIAAGVILNTIPMVAHGGLMPVSFEAIQANGANPELTEAHVGEPIAGSKNILLHRDEIRFEWLADRFHPDWPGVGTAIFSAGDAVEVAGIATILVQLAVVFGGAIVHRRRGDEMAGDRPGATGVA
ncbi:MAG: hypothetical protein Kow0010_10290 [Dehalococcoidia bacterium]